MADPRTDDIPAPEEEPRYGLLERPGVGKYGIPAFTQADKALENEWGFGQRTSPDRSVGREPGPSFSGNGPLRGVNLQDAFDSVYDQSQERKPGPEASATTAGMMGTKPVQPRAMTPDELSRLGDQMLAQARAEQASVRPGGYVSQLYGLDRQTPPAWQGEKKKKAP